MNERSDPEEMDLEMQADGGRVARGGRGIVGGMRHFTEVKELTVEMDAYGWPKISEEDIHVLQTNCDSVADPVLFQEQHAIL